MASNMAEMLKELFGIDLALLTNEERGELTERMLKAALKNEELASRTRTRLQMLAIDWPIDEDDEEPADGIAMLRDLHAREDISYICGQVFNALEALKRHAHAAP